VKDLNIFITKSTEFVKNVIQRVLRNRYISLVYIVINIAFSLEIPSAKAETENANITNILQYSTHGVVNTEILVYTFINSTQTRVSEFIGL